VTTRSARRRSAEAAAQAAAGGSGAKNVTPPAKQARRTAAVDGREAWQQLLQSPQHAALLQRPPFQWLPPPTSQQQQQQPSTADADADAEMRTAPALPAEAWQVNYGPEHVHTGMCELSTAGPLERGCQMLLLEHRLVSDAHAATLSEPGSAFAAHRHWRDCMRCMRTARWTCCGGTCCSRLGSC
jgi:hypothetical protein